MVSCSGSGIQAPGGHFQQDAPGQRGRIPQSATARVDRHATGGIASSGGVRYPPSPSARARAADPTSSATICARAVRTPVPSSTLPAESGHGPIRVDRQPVVQPGGQLAPGGLPPARARAACPRPPAGVACQPGLAIFMLLILQSIARPSHGPQDAPNAIRTGTGSHPEPSGSVRRSGAEFSIKARRWI